uniref:(northern house mosquito) hypothetical protein n=1 Tax=Culex pipiens TaxID=7175 RepID=A0A8D8CUK9_CULPI
MVFLPTSRSLRNFFLLLFTAVSHSPEKKQKQQPLLAEFLRRTSSVMMAQIGHCRGFTENPQTPRCKVICTTTLRPLTLPSFHQLLPLFFPVVTSLFTAYGVQHLKLL